MKVLVTDFFGSVRNVELSNKTNHVVTSSRGSIEARPSPPVERQPLRHVNVFPSPDEVIHEVLVLM